jgi:hypothetical protein
LVPPAALGETKFVIWDKPPKKCGTKCEQELWGG